MKTHSTSTVIKPTRSCEQREKKSDNKREEEGGEEERSKKNSVVLPVKEEREDGTRSSKIQDNAYLQVTRPVSEE